MSSKISAPQHWLYLIGTHRYETRDFKLPLHDLSPEALTSLTPISDWLLRSGPMMIPLFEPKHHIEIRRTLAYLSDLRQRQSEAWFEQLGIWDKETEKLNQQLSFSQN